MSIYTHLGWADRQCLSAISLAGIPFIFIQNRNHFFKITLKHPC